MTVVGSESFKYKAALVGKTTSAVNTNSPLINCKIHLELNWIEDCILSSAGDSAKFKITDAKLHAPIVTLSIKYNVSLTKQLSNGFTRSVYLNSYQIIPAKVINNDNNINELLSASLQGVIKSN